MGASISALAGCFIVSACDGTVWAQNQLNPPKKSESAACSNDDSGLKLPAGFCATVFADGIGHARHMVVGPSGVVYVNTWSGDYFGSDKPHEGGFLVALQDKSGTGKADVIERFGETVQSGGAGGTGIGIYKGSIYAEVNDRIVRYSLPAGALVPRDPPETIVSGLPLGGDHPMHPFIISEEGSMYVDVATATNSCQPKNRQPNIPGANPCTELETRGGIWRYDANKTNQTFSPADRFATGYAMAKALPSTPRGAFSSPSMGEINCMRIGPISTNPPRKPLYRPKS
jgi:glucose/arabinose dehydrogenase